MNKWGEEIKTELRRRHDAGQATGEDRLYRDALELIEGLARALEKYGDHAIGCRYLTIPPIGDCDCGLDMALAGDVRGLEFDE